MNSPETRDRRQVPLSIAPLPEFRQSPLVARSFPIFPTIYFFLFRLPLAAEQKLTISRGGDNAALPPKKAPGEEVDGLAVAVGPTATYLAKGDARRPRARVCGSPWT